MKSLNLLIILAVFISSGLISSVHAQSEKDEVERSISKTEMPEKAVELIDEFWPDLEGIKYFLETDGTLTTYEAKLDWRGSQYSIEFSTGGYVLDVEQLITFDAIPESTADNIVSDLESRFRSYRITRLQRQYIAMDEDDEDDEDFIDDILEEDAEDYEIRYEIELDGENRQELGSFELLYSDSGSLIERRRIVRRSLDNIW
ncbi:hypothetical protein [Rhodohalobacter mucosus]|uniref:PepSY domain-containing protein n=1 Tax=Rhodohalobacter mucosus TaxID=2079485 RepID=A0A316TRS4_9BACT|nr:hypothetical protein [Rhodohalobacter mucosus]PWN05705.1 hypothetical protein DDZ15_14055 [Rhodohalobacter mucosus]